MSLWLSGAQSETDWGHLSLDQICPIPFGVKSVEQSLSITAFALIYFWHQKCVNPPDESVKNLGPDPQSDFLARSRKSV